MFKYNYLSDAFKKWYEEKTTPIKPLDYEHFKKEVLVYAEHSDKEFEVFDLLLKKLCDFGPPDIMHLLLKRFEDFYTESWVPKEFHMKFEYSDSWLPLALEWTLIQIKDLNLFNMDEFNVKEPYNQCHYCGKPDCFNHITGKKPFNKRTKYCHSYDCDFLSSKYYNRKGMLSESGSNPSLHPDCCYGKFAILRKSLSQRLRSGRTNKEKTELFLKLCDELLEKNLNINWTVQTKDKKAIEKNLLWENL